jgi:hypothetical protein
MDMKGNSIYRMLPRIASCGNAIASGGITDWRTECPGRYGTKPLSVFLAAHKLYPVPLRPTQHQAGLIAPSHQPGGQEIQNNRKIAANLEASARSSESCFTHRRRGFSPTSKELGDFDNRVVLFKHQTGGFLFEFWRKRSSFPGHQAPRL